MHFLPTTVYIGLLLLLGPEKTSTPCSYPNFLEQGHLVAMLLSPKNVRFKLKDPQFSSPNNGYISNVFRSK